MSADEGDDCPDLVPATTNDPLPTGAAAVPATAVTATTVPAVTGAGAGADPTAAPLASLPSANVDGSDDVRVPVTIITGFLGMLCDRPLHVSCTTRL